MSILRVDQIQHSNGTAALTIDSSGRVVTPNRPAFFAASTQGTHTTNVSAVLDFGNAQINIGNHYNTGSYRFIAPVAGVYYFHTTVWTQQAASPVQLCWRKNGVQYSVGDVATFIKSTAAGADHTIVNSIMLSLVVNDYVDLVVRAATNNVQWYGLHSWFMGYLVS